MSVQTVAPSPTALQLHIEEKFKTLTDICERFYAIQEGLQTSGETTHYVLKKIDENRDILSQLDITIPPEEMKDIFDQYGVVALRKLQNSNLVVFCGNRPLFSPLTQEKCGPDSRQIHEHSGCDTIDISVLSNPSCVVAWPPHSKALEYLSQQQYKKIEGEKSLLQYDPGNLPEAEKSLTALQKLLKAGGTASPTDYRQSIINHSRTRRVSNAEKIKSYCAPRWYLEWFKWYLTPTGPLTQIKKFAETHGFKADISGPAWGGSSISTATGEYKVSYKLYSVQLTKTN